MAQLRPDDFAQDLGAHPDQVVVVFFWGRHCPNCEVAKRFLLEKQGEYKKFDFHWAHVNTYEDADLGIQYGLHGIPTFLFFKNGKILGRATSYPGHDEFLNVLKIIKEKAQI